MNNLADEDSKQRLDDSKLQARVVVDKSTKMMGLTGPNDQTHSFNKIVAFNNGTGEYKDEGTTLKLASLRNKTGNTIVLIEWKEDKPGQYGKERFTWENMNSNVPEHLHEKPIYYDDLKEGVR